MSLADRLADRLAPPASEPCPFPGLLSALDDRDADALRRALNPKAMNNKDLRDHLLAEGHRVSELQVRRHKKGACTCRLPIAS